MKVLEWKAFEALFIFDLNLYLSFFVRPIRSNEVWVLDLEQWSWSKPPIAGPSPHPRGGQSQVRRLHFKILTYIKVFKKSEFCL